MPSGLTLLSSLHQEATGISGLYWEQNVHSETSGGFERVQKSAGPGVTDLVTHEPNFAYHHYGIHIGQNDRLTFFGDPSQTIKGDFVDCRIGSPTLHKHIRLNFSPSHKRKLVIERGIAHSFRDIEHILTRDEPVWFMADNNPAYSLANDVLNFPLNAREDDIPTVQVNDLPIPVECYSYVLSKQHEIYDQQTPVYGMRYKIKDGAADRYVLVTQKSWQRPIAPQSTGQGTAPDTVFWVNSYYASSGGNSYYIVESKNVKEMEFFIQTEPQQSIEIVEESEILLTFVGYPDATGNIEFANQQGASIGSLSFQPDPLHSLRVPGGMQVRLTVSGFITTRLERLLSTA